jgi:hypothetical protein
MLPGEKTYSYRDETATADELLKKYATLTDDELETIAQGSATYKNLTGNVANKKKMHSC